MGPLAKQLLLVDEQAVALDAGHDVRCVVGQGEARLRLGPGDQLLSLPVPGVSRPLRRGLRPDYRLPGPGVDARIFENYKDVRWLYHVVTERANIELMFNDPYWARFEFRPDYPFGVFVFNVSLLTSGFHPSEFSTPTDNPYLFAKKEGMKVETLDDYLAVLDRLFEKAKSAGRGLPQDHDCLPADTTLRESLSQPGRQGLGAPAVN